MVKLAGAVVACAIAAFAVAFYAAGAGESDTKHVKTHPEVVPFADAAAGAVALSLAGRPAALKLPPPRPVRHHAKPAATVAPPVTAAPAPTPTASTAPTYTPPPSPVYTPTPRHKSSGGTGTGTTVVGP